MSDGKGQLRDRTGASRAAGDAASRGMSAMRQLLERALRPVPADRDLGQRVIAAMAPVARKYHGQPFAVAPIGVEMVACALRAYFESAGPSAVWDSLALPLARTLGDDPVAGERLRKLWLRLSEEMA
jgi:hypothetical protein